MGKLRINCGNSDWHIDMSLAEFQAALVQAKEKGEHLQLTRMFGDCQDSILYVDPSRICYYSEEIDAAEDCQH